LEALSLFSSSLTTLGFVSRARSFSPFTRHRSSLSTSGASFSTCDGNAACMKVSAYVDFSRQTTAVLYLPRSTFTGWQVLAFGISHYIPDVILFALILNYVSQSAHFPYTTYTHTLSLSLSHTHTHKHTHTHAHAHLTHSLTPHTLSYLSEPLPRESARPYHDEEEHSLLDELRHDCLLKCSCSSMSSYSFHINSIIHLRAKRKRVLLCMSSYYCICVSVETLGLRGAASPKQQRQHWHRHTRR